MEISLHFVQTLVVRCGELLAFCYCQAVESKCIDVVFPCYFKGTLWRTFCLLHTDNRFVCEGESFVFAEKAFSLTLRQIRPHNNKANEVQANLAFKRETALWLVHSMLPTKHTHDWFSSTFVNHMPGAATFFLTLISPYIRNHYSSMHQNEIIGPTVLDCLKDWLWITMSLRGR